MKSSVKIIKRKQNEDSINLETAAVEVEKSAEQTTREMVSTVKGWIAELQQRKRAQSHVFPSLPVIGSAQVRQTT